jgi:antitoxin ChpS
MAKTSFRTVDGSVVVVVPAAYLERAGLASSGELGWEIRGDRLVLCPDAANSPPFYTLDELLAECDASADPPDADPDWTTGGPVGRELI